ncbi:MAG: hypothetical protein JSR83_08975 [Proteobacteria bacterium]|nr:hypothetical protein [Pseudomonadota bacterium]
MNTLSDGVTTVILPNDLLRTDEYSWSPIRQSQSFTLGGALWVDESIALVGEPITLAAGDDYGFMTRGEFSQLRALASQSEKTWTLTYRGIAYDVIWRHSDAPALSARDLIDYADPLPTDIVIPTLKFTRIS